MWNYDKKLFEKANKEKKNVLLQQPTIPYFSIGLHRFKKKKIAVFFLFFFTFIFVLSFVLPFFYDFSYDKQFGVSRTNTNSRFESILPFSRDPDGNFHFLGTDRNGHDFFIRLLNGIKITLTTTLIATFITLIIGLFLGITSGVKGKKTDLIIMRIIEIFFSLPDVVILILLSVFINQKFSFLKEYSFTRQLSNIIYVPLAFPILYWVKTAYFVRNQTIHVMNKDFILTSKSMGASDFFIARKHIIPNIKNNLIVHISELFRFIIASETFLSLLGIGSNSEYPSLGCLISENKNYFFDSDKFLIVIPLFVFCLIIASFAVICDSLQSAFDYKQNK